MKRKGIKALGIILLVAIIFATIGLVFYHYDSIRVVHGKRPRYCIKIDLDDGNKVVYLGLGYKVVAYTGVSPKEPYGFHPYKKMIGWFDKFEKPLDHNMGEDITKIKTIDDFYNMSITKENDIRDLSPQYSVFDAEKDGVYVATSGKNKEKFDSFMNRYSKGENAYIRLAYSTKEGELILYDILYISRIDRVFVIVDSSRDNLGEATQELQEYDQLKIVDDKIVLYNKDNQSEMTLP